MNNNTAVQMDDLLSALNVVDELRHKEMSMQKITEGGRELLMEQLKAYYERNSLHVTDDILNRAIDAHLGQRFVYQPPSNRAAALLAEMYVDRIVWYKRLAVSAAFCLAAGALYYGLAVYPEKARVRRDVESINSHISRTDALVDNLDAKASTTLPDMECAHMLTRSACERMLRDAKNDYESGVLALGLLKSAPEIEKLRIDEYSSRFDPMSLEIQNRYAAINSAESRINGSFEKISAISRLASLHDSIFSLERSLGQVEKYAALSERKDAAWSSAIAGLESGDINQASVAYDSLRKLIDQSRSLNETSAAAGRIKPSGVSSDREALKELQTKWEIIQSYIEDGDSHKAASALKEYSSLVSYVSSSITYRIVSDAGVRSGIWRYHDKIPNVKNYYVVVDAISNGKPVDILIVNEEDNSKSMESRFAVRVAEAFYESVKDDKMDNGIIDNSIIGEKERGKMSASFNKGIIGGYITSW